MAIGFLEKIVNAVPRVAGALGEKMYSSHPVAGRVIGTGVGYAAEVVAVAALPVVGGIASTVVAVASPVLYAVRKMKGKDKKY